MVSLSSSLTAVCNPGTEWNSELGDTVEKTWVAPSSVDAQVKAEARAKLPNVLRLAADAELDTIRKWLASLGVMCAGQMSATDAKAKMAVLAPMLKHPGSSFTEDTLREAARKFKWFPSFAEVDEFLDKKSRPIKALSYRLQRIIAAPERKPQNNTKAWRDMTQEERDAFDQMMRGNKEVLRRGMTDDERQYADRKRDAAA
jgi:hypothetical protein